MRVRICILYWSRVILELEVFLHTHISVYRNIFSSLWTLLMLQAGLMPKEPCNSTQGRMGNVGLTLIGFCVSVASALPFAMTRATPELPSVIFNLQLSLPFPLGESESGLGLEVSWDIARLSNWSLPAPGNQACLVISFASSSYALCP